MKSLYFILGLLFVVACSPEKDIALAEQYKEELQYYQYSVNFAKKNMNSEALSSCDRTDLLRNECFTSYVQVLLEKEQAVDEAYCDEIHPEEKSQMTKKAFKLVYGEIDDALAEEIKEKLSPSQSRIQTLTEIKERCYSSS